MQIGEFFCIQDQSFQSFISYLILSKVKSVQIGEFFCIYD